MNEIDRIYLNLCNNLLNAPHVNIAEDIDDKPNATSGQTREMNNVKIILNDINQNIVSVRGISPSYLFGEWLWYFTGRNDVKFISKFGKIWEQMSDDGVTNNSAYGYLMQKAFGFNQIEKIIQLLKKDPSSRRAVININTPNPQVIDTKDEPCTIALQFLIRKGKLDCTAMMRSNDIWLGFPYDVAFFTELQKYIADQLELRYGTYTHFVVSMHLYDRHYEDVKKVINNPISKPFTFNRAAFHRKKNFIAELVDVAINSGNKNIKEITLDLAKTYFEYQECEPCKYWDCDKCLAQRNAPYVGCNGNKNLCEK